MGVGWLEQTFKTALNGEFCLKTVFMFSIYVPWQRQAQQRYKDNQDDQGKYDHIKNKDDHKKDYRNKHHQKSFSVIP